MRLFLILLLVVSTNAVSADQSFRSANLDLNNLPQKVLIIKPEIYVREVSVGGVAERVEDWSDAAKQNVLNTIDEQINNQHLFDKVLLPEMLSDVIVDSLDEHIALYDVVGFNAFYYGRATLSGWKHKKTEFDYTLGSGLSEIADLSGADAALFIVGEDHISSGGRKAARIFAALLGVALPASPTFLSAGLVDLRTGDLLWMNYGTALDTKDLRKPEDVKEMLGEMMLYYPGRVAALDE